jgi:hypothetical protein
MSEELVVSSTETGQKENPELRRRFEARALKEKENLTLAEKLILAQAEETLVYTFDGIELEILVPNREEHDKLVKLLSNYIKRGTDDEPLSDEYYKQALEELAGFMAEFFVDESITPELISSGVLDISFLLKFQTEINEYMKQKSTEVTAVNGFRKNKRG